MIYLASPYSHDDPRIREQRFREVCLAAGLLLRCGVTVFSPIAHSHPIAVHGNLPTDFAWWRQFDEAMVGVCDELWVLQLAGWMESRGVSAEIQVAAELGKVVRYATADRITDLPRKCHMNGGGA